MQKRTLTLILTVVATFLALHAAGERYAGTESQAERGPVTLDAGRFESLQAAVDALPPEGGCVRIPAGEFRLNEPLRVSRDDVCLEGSGSATSIVNLNERGQPAVLLEHPDGVDDREHELWRIRVANLRIVGNEKSGHGIEARRINELFVDGVTVSYHGGDGIHLRYCYEDPRICDSLITYNKATGVNLVGCHDIVVSANQFEENDDGLRCIDGFNLTMTGNNLDDHLGRGVLIENTYGSVLSGNMIEECMDFAVVLDRDCYGITVSANVIAHNGGGLDLVDAHGCAVSANTFTIMKTDALRIGPGSGRIAVTGNSFSDSYIGEGEVRRAANDLEAAGVRLEGTRDVALTGNVFSGLRPVAITAAGEASERILVTQNVVVDAPLDLDDLRDSRVAENLLNR